MRNAFQKWVLSRLWLTFIVLGVSFLAFGAGTVNLGFLFMANARLLNQYGLQAVMDGALQQLAELVLTGYASLAAYVVFKACEHRLSDWLAGAGHPHAHEHSAEVNEGGAASEVSTPPAP